MVSPAQTVTLSGAGEGVKAGEWKPSVNPWMVALSVMLASFMVALDSSIANVALPHIAGSLSASTDESTWVLTSYLVSNGIMLPASSWITKRIGRKRLLMISILTFTVASVLCGLALNMPMLIVARILQGAGGGGMPPLAQAILLESFPVEKQGKAMAMFGIGIVVAPVVGPTLGGWITDSYSWRWIFNINVPVGLLALFMANLYIEDPPYLRQARRTAIDAVGFGLMAVWLGTLQLVLDKGQEADWFGASWICWLTAVSVAAFVGFVVRELVHSEPIVELRALKNRNFAIGTAMTGFYGVAALWNHGVSAAVSADHAGLLRTGQRAGGEPAGCGRDAGNGDGGDDGEPLRRAGFAGDWAGDFWGFVGGDQPCEPDISMAAVILPNFFNGFGGGFVFVPLTTLAMGRLRKEEIGNAAGIYNLVRNIGGSIGIAALTAEVVRGAQVHQSYLGANLTAGERGGVDGGAGADGAVYGGRERPGDGAVEGAGDAVQQFAAAGYGAGLCGQLPAAGVSVDSVHRAGGVVWGGGEEGTGRPRGERGLGLAVRAVASVVPDSEAGQSAKWLFGAAESGVRIPFPKFQRMHRSCLENLLGA